MLALIPKTLIDIDTVFHLKTEIEAISILKVKKVDLKIYLCCATSCNLVSHP